MRIAGLIFLLSIALCSFLHYPLAVISPIGVKDSISLVFSFEFPHVFLASILSLVYLAFQLGQLDFKSKLNRLFAAGIALIVLSAAIYSVPFYRAIETMSFFTVPLAVYLALKKCGTKDLLYYAISLLFVLNLIYCLAFSNKVGIAGNKNWLAATLIMSFPFLVLSLKKLPQKAFYTISVLISLPLIYVLIQTSVRALIPAVGAFVFYFSVQRKPLKFNAFVFGGLTCLIIVVAMMKSDKVSRVLNQDIRGPLFKDGLSLALSVPFLGTGPGNFQKDFPPHASDTLKKRIYYSSIVEHPHNELINLAANCGIPVAIIWLLFLFSLLKKREDFEGIVLQFGLICGFVMGLADKPLVESPSAIIFLLLCGLLIKDEDKLEKEESVKALKLTGPVLAVAVLVFGVLRIKADVGSRYHFWQGENVRSVMNSRNQKQIVPKMFEHYKKSAEIDLYFINAAYNATATSLHFYNSLSQDQKLLEHMIELEPDFSDFNKWIGLYYMKQARLLGEGKEKDDTEAEAESYYLRNFELSPWNINRCRELIRFYVETENEDKIEEWIVKAGEIARERLKTRYTHTDRINLEEDLDMWVKDVEEGKSTPFNIFDKIKANQAGDYYKFGIFNKISLLRDFPQRGVNSFDYDFWHRRLSLIKEMKALGIKSTQDILNFMASFKVDESTIKWPLDTLGNRKGSTRSITSLACTMNNLLGNTSSLLVNEEGLVLCVLFNENESFIWNCAKGELYDTSLDAFHNDPKLRASISGSEKDDFVYELFCYPEAFCLRNQVLSSMLSIHPEVPEFCLSPTLERVRLSKKNGAREIRYANAHIGLLIKAALK